MAMQPFRFSIDEGDYTFWADSHVEATKMAKAWAKKRKSTFHGDSATQPEG